MIHLDRLNSEVAEEYGKRLPIRIVEDSAPNFDWNSVNLPTRVLEEGEETIRNILRHEYGHLFINPRSVASAETIFYLAKTLGIRYYQDAANVVSDLLVDSTLMGRHREEYLRFLERYLGDAEHPVLRAMASFYAVHARKLGLKTVLQEDSLGRNLYRNLMDSGQPLYVRIYRALQILRYLFVDRVEVPHSVTVIVVKVINEARARRVLERSGLILDGAGRRGVGTFGMFRLIDNPSIIGEREMEAEMVLEDLKTSPLERVSYGIWRAGDEPRDLDLVKSLENSGIVIPGVSAMARRISEDRGDDEEGKLSSLAIVVDCSGSMAREKFRAAQILILKILEVAERSGASVALIPFSSGIDDSRVVYPTKEYDEVREFLLRIEPAGGTMMRRALEFARSMDVDKYIVLTDASIGDVEESMEILDTLDRTIVVVLESSEDVATWVMNYDEVYVLDANTFNIIGKEEVT